MKCSATENAGAALELHAIRMSFGLTRAVKVGHGAIANARATLEQPGTQMNFGHKRPPSASYLKHFHDTLTNVASRANASELPSLFPDKLIAAVPAKHARCITFPDTLSPSVSKWLCIAIHFRQSFPRFLAIQHIPNCADFKQWKICFSKK